MAQVKEVVIVRKMSQFLEGSFGFQFGRPDHSMPESMIIFLDVDAEVTAELRIHIPSIRKAGLCFGAASVGLAEG